MATKGKTAAPKKSVVKKVTKKSSTKIKNCFGTKENPKELSVYVGKYRPGTGYGEFYKGKTKWHTGAVVLARKQSKVGDKVILKDKTKIVKTGTIVHTGGLTVNGKKAKTVKWDD